MAAKLLSKWLLFCLRLLYAEGGEALAAAVTSAPLLASVFPDRLFVADFDGWHAALALVNGSRLWSSAPFEEQSSLVQASIGDGVLLTASTSGAIRASDAVTGKLRWASEPDGSPCFALFESTCGLIEVLESEVRCMDAQGRSSWSFSAKDVPALRASDDSATEEPHFWSASASNGEVCALAVSSDLRKARVAVLDGATGKVLREKKVPRSIRTLLTGSALAAGSHIAAIEAETLYAWPLCEESSKEPLSWDLSLVRLSGQDTHNFFVPWARTQGAFVVSNGHFTFVFRITAGGLKPYINNAVSAVGPVHGSSDAQVVMGAHKKDTFEIKLLTGENQDAGTYSLSDYSERVSGPVHHIAAIEVSTGSYIFLLRAEKTLAATDGSQVLWQKPIEDLRRGQANDEL